MADGEKPFYEKYPLYDQFWYRGKLCSGFNQDVELFEMFQKVEIRDTDVLIASYPKSGTTWVSEIVSVLMEPEDVMKRPLIERVAFFSAPLNMEQFNNMSRDKPRVFHTHLTPEWLPKQLEAEGNIISVWRNPKDVAVSFFHMYKFGKTFNWYNGSWSEFLEAFMKGWVQFGSVFDYTIEWLEVTTRENVLVVKYEELKEDPHSSIRKIAEFLGKNIDEGTLDKIVEHTSFSKMKDNKMTNMSEFNEAGKYLPGCSFYRKGVVGDWKNHFTVAQNEEFQKVVDEKFSSHKEAMTVSGLI